MNKKDREAMLKAVEEEYDIGIFEIRYVDFETGQRIGSKVEVLRGESFTSWAKDEIRKRRLEESPLL